ncbi:MAG: hypothetical protein Q7U47_15105 [Paludibacter sp.]|nr:hypothetical protein [Paludibacter sp.]
MNQSLFPENELFGFTKPSLVLYVEDSYNPELNDFIQSNFKQIVEYYTAKEIDFCYLPYLLQNENYQAVVSYNRPYLHHVNDGNSIAEIYRKIKRKLAEPLEGAGLIWVYDIDIDKDSEVAYGYQLDADKSLIDEFNRFADAINVTQQEDKQKHTPAWKRRLPKDSTENEPPFLAFDSQVEESSTPYRSDVQFMIVREKDADSEFDFEAYRLADEIRTRIQLLKESGSLCLIGDILEEIQGATKKLSNIFITNDYRIFLKDYGMKEVVMPPLPKSLFILFLRHPEGILFKQLSNYHDELLSIYRNITVRENIDQAIESIKAMTDPLNNSINEKCSRVRAAFLEIIADDLAQNYYVTGKRGEPKKIILDRTLVEFQK